MPGVREKAENLARKLSESRKRVLIIKLIFHYGIFGFGFGDVCLCNAINTHRMFFTFSTIFLHNFFRSLFFSSLFIQMNFCDMWLRVDLMTSHKWSIFHNLKTCYRSALCFFFGFCSLLTSWKREKSVIFASVLQGKREMAGREIERKRDKSVFFAARM